MDLVQNAKNVFVLLCSDIYNKILNHEKERESDDKKRIFMCITRYFRFLFAV